MSIEAISWVLNDAPIPQPTPSGTPNSSTLAMVLLGLANHAGRDGTDAYPSVRTMARYARLSDRQVQRCLRSLLDYGLIEPGDQRIVEAKIEDPLRRPVVYNLVMKPQVSRGDALSPRKAKSQVGRGDTLSPGDRHDASGVTGTTSRGDTHVTRTVLEPSNEPKGSPSPGMSPARATDPPSLEIAPSTAADAGPSPFCDRHPDGADHPCGPCGEARRAAEAWEAEQQHAAKARLSVDAQARAEVRRAAIEACGLCDDDGYRDGRLCHHRPEQDAINARGVEECRKVLRGARVGA